MKLGYSYRLSQYAFFLGLLGLTLVGGVIFFLNLVTLRTEQYQTRLSTRLTHAVQSTHSTQSADAPPEEASSPEYSVPPNTSNLSRIAARQTMQMLRPMIFYLTLTGGTWIVLQGVRSKVTG